MKSMTSVITKSALVLAACASMNAFAGTSSGKAPAPAPEPESGALFDTLGATLEVGYDTRYYWRGLYRADNTVWAGLSLSVPLTEQLSLGFGAVYTDSVDGSQIGSQSFDYSELDLSTGLTYDAGFAKIGLVYNRYTYFDTFTGLSDGVSRLEGTEGGITGANEVGLTLATSVGPVNFTAGYWYNFTIGGSYAQVGAELPIEITSWLSIVPAVQLGYGFDYFTAPQLGAASSGLTHVIPSISAPIKLTKTATLTPYIAYNISLDSRHNTFGAATGIPVNGNAQDNEIFGGVKLSVNF
ncbi:MAG: hypothetical protein CJBNEKGG_03215 [Prosthecobacter sp.]|nr:hypothetical protein [Prosthecobacter sp.]